MVVLDGRNLTIKKLADIAYKREPVRVQENQWKKIRRSQAFITKRAAGKQAIYGINTGFGALAQVRITKHDLEKLQHNLLLSHSAGIGVPFSPEMVRAALALRINTLVRGYSGVSERLIKTMVALVNNDIMPVVPQKGSVGASGDLAPMAAMSLAVIGKGAVLYAGKVMSAQKAMRQAHITPLTLKPKEGLSLINGTQFSTSIAGIINAQGLRLCAIADMCGAMSVDALRGSTVPFGESIFKLRPHPGALDSANSIRRYLKGSKISESHRHCSKVQDPYSLRCMAQVHGAVRDIFQFAKKTIEIEMNSVTDNPIVVPEQNMILNSGNFHGEPIAFVLDMMAIGLAELASISERRIFRLLDSTFSGLSPFLAVHPGLNSGFMMAQVVAAALVSQNKVLCHPASVDSIPTSAHQEDHVSMSMNAGIKALEVIENATYVLAIELLCACQALDMLAPLKTSPQLERIKDKVRTAVPFTTSDTILTTAIEAVKSIIDGELKDKRLL